MGTIETPEVDAWEAWAACTDRCDDPAMHERFTSGRLFRWCWPKFDRMTGADKVTTLTLNRYPHNVIGVALYVRGHGFGIRWKAM